MRVKHNIRETATVAASTHQDDYQAGRLLLLLRGSRHCTRCGGLLVTERLDSAADSLFEQQVSALRCIQCGDILDRVILRNRLDPAAAGRARREDVLWADDPESYSPLLEEVRSA